MSVDKLKEMLHRISPIGRLETHEGILSYIDGKLPPEIDLEPYRRCIRISRQNWGHDEITARAYLEKADKELLHLQWLRSKEVEVGAKQLGWLDSRRGQANATKKQIAEEYAARALEFASVSRATRGALVFSVKAKMDAAYSDQGKTFSTSTIRRYLAPVLKKDFQTG